MANQKLRTSFASAIRVSVNEGVAEVAYRPSRLPRNPNFCISQHPSALFSNQLLYGWYVP